MIFREAILRDIQQIQIVRHTVRENTLPNRELVTNKDCEEYLTERGKGWVCEIDDQIVGFSIADLKDNCIWALFLRPEFEGKGIGRHLHDTMLDWYFAQTQDKVWLVTEVNTRAEKFYRKSGWTEAGSAEEGEIKFEMTHNIWMKMRKGKKI